MGQAIFLPLQPLTLQRILELGRLQFGQQPLLLGAALLQLVPVGAGLLQARRRLFPIAPGRRHWLQQGLEGFPSKAIQPTALLTRAGELLGLALHGEVKQQGAQLLDLGTAHHHPVEPVAAGQTVLAEAPLAAEQQFLLLQVQLLLLQPALQGR